MCGLLAKLHIISKPSENVMKFVTLNICSLLNISHKYMKKTTVILLIVAFFFRKTNLVRPPYRSTQPCMTPSCQLHVEWHAPTYPEALRRLGTDGHPGENTRVPHTLLALLNKLDPIHVRRSEARAFTKHIGRASFSREIVVPVR